MRSATPRCTACGYDLAGSPLAGGMVTCPECGLRQSINASWRPPPLLWPGWVAVIAGLLPSLAVFVGSLDKRPADLIVAGLVLFAFTLASPLLAGVVGLLVGVAVLPFAPDRWRVVPGAVAAMAWTFALNLLLTFVACPLAVLVRVLVD